MGKDLDDLRLTYGLSKTEGRALFGMTELKWSKTVIKGATQPVHDATVALLARLLDYNHWLFTPPKPPTPEEMKALLEEAQGAPMDQKRLAILLGQDGSAGHRWLKQHARQHPPVQALSCFLKKAFEAIPPDNWSQTLDTWEEIVRREGQVRTSADVFKTGRWTAKDCDAVSDAEDV